MLLLFASCKDKKVVELTEVDDFANTEITEESSIGEKHNFLLGKAFEKFGLGLRSEGGPQEAVSIHKVVDYWLSLEIFKDVTKEERYKVQTLVESVVSECKEQGIETTVGVSKYFSEKYSSLRSSESNYTDIDFVYSDIYNHSFVFWSKMNGVKYLRGAGDEVIAADAAGGAWGLCFGGLGSIIGSAVASLMANNPKTCLDAASSYDWKCNPKYL